MTTRTRKSKANSKNPEAILEDDLRRLRTRLDAIAAPLIEQARTRLRAKLIAPLGDLAIRVNALDPIREPAQVFDPARPSTAGRLVALALLAQPKYPLADIARFYGSGVYAIYYKGIHPAYQAISQTETPIYIGKADPQSSEADTPRDQGDRLSGRLRDHRKSIRTVQEYAEPQNLPNPLKIHDFEYRRLVVASNAQMAAERYLIKIFKPVWNDEFKICWGISKHGDAASTRSNKRSPWDTMHPGRLWALDEKLKDKKSAAQIVDDIKRHLETNVPIMDQQQIMNQFLKDFIQEPPTRADEDPVSAIELDKD
ncbi:Eco29kI family restriction endonuclease [Corallococcus sicarius]|uniref:Eco29kI family restriction endonuclease n=1 Tax=Corallococcus sicarius TaxID=2316726 RepID=A0A3A8MZD0_9BACT|nr:Eco29kI family restriction endonuclease [Corallococcus sicarius]RKH36680.1 Eco29kI family restriction endonuclease [Corallococcus sicarius]